MGLDLYTRNHDPLTFITPDSRSQPQIGGIPVGMVMNMNSMAPRFFNQQSVQSKYSLKVNQIVFFLGLVNEGLSFF